MKITFLIRSLDFGGAERQLAILAKGLHLKGHSVTIITFYATGTLDRELRDLGIPIRSLEKKGRWDLLRFARRLREALKEETPDVLHGYLTESNLVGAFIKPFFPRLRLVWGVRASYVDFSRYHWLIRYLYRFECMMSRVPNLIIANSKAGIEFAVSNGFPRDKMITIPNGIDTEKFQPDRDAGVRVRAEWGAGPEEILIGMVGRLDPMKDHPTFLRAAALFAPSHPNVRFVLIGDGLGPYREGLVDLCRDLSITDRVIWAGARNDIPAVFNAIDVSTLSSVGEGFPNVVGEAMACGCRCVVTDVGDAAWLVGEAGWVVPPGDAERLAEGWETAFSIERDAAALISRRRIIDNFSAEQMILRTERTLEDLIDTKRC